MRSRHSSLVTCHSSLVTRHYPLVTIHLSLSTCHYPLVTKYTNPSSLREALCVVSTQNSCCSLRRCWCCWQLQPTRSCLRWLRASATGDSTAVPCRVDGLALIITFERFPMMDFVTAWL